MKASYSIFFVLLGVLISWIAPEVRSQETTPIQFAAPENSLNYRWVDQNPLPSAHTINGMWGNSESDVFTVGDAGTILHYDGKSWSKMQSNTETRLNAVWGSSGKDIYAVGDQFTILHYDGSAWVNISKRFKDIFDLYSYPISFTDVWGTSESDVYIAGSSILLHYNGSVWFNLVYDQPDTGEIYRRLSNTLISSVCGRSPSEVYFGSPQYLYKYDGANYTLIDLAIPGFICTKIWTCPDSGLYAIGSTGVNGVFLRYDGTSWTTLSDQHGLFYAIWGTSDANIFIAGDYGLYHYNGVDLSLKVKIDDFPGLNRSTSLWGSSSSNVMVAGQNGLLARYDGNALTPMNQGITAMLSGIWGSSDSDVFTVGGNGFIGHYDGNTWSAMTSGIEGKKSSIDNPVILMDIWGSSKTDVFTVGGCSTILHYDGNFWTTLSAHYDSNNGYNGIWGSSSSDVFVVGDGGIILHYDGAEWNEMPNGLPETINRMPLYDVWGSSSSDVFAVGERGIILHYDGSSWSLMTSGLDGFTLSRIWGSSGTDIYAFGGYGNNFFLHYDGQEWTRFEISAGSFTSMWGSSASDIFVTNGYQINHYDGKFWSSTITGISNYAEYFSALWGNSSTDVFAVGFGGQIYHYQYEEPPIFPTPNETPWATKTPIPIPTNTPTLTYTLTQTPIPSPTPSPLPTSTPGYDPEKPYTIFWEPWDAFDPVIWASRGGTWTTSNNVLELAQINSSAIYGFAQNTEINVAQYDMPWVFSYDIKIDEENESGDAFYNAYIRSENPETGGTLDQFALSLNHTSFAGKVNDRLSFSTLKSNENFQSPNLNRLSAQWYTVQLVFHNYDIDTGKLDLEAFLIHRETKEIVYRQAATVHSSIDFNRVKIQISIQVNGTVGLVSFDNFRWIADPAYKIDPTPTPIPAQEIPLNTVIVTDNLQSSQDLTGGFDQDDPLDRALVIRWNAGNQACDLINIAVYVNNSKNSIPLTTLNHGTYFEWRQGAANLSPLFLNGPQFGDKYTFIVTGLFQGPPVFEIRSADPVLFLSANESTPIPGATEPISIASPTPTKIPYTPTPKPVGVWDWTVY